MVDRDTLIAEAGDRLVLAPFKPDEWLAALRCVAQATGSRHGQLAGWMPPNKFPFNLLTDEPDGVIQRWLEVGGADPARNPIIRRGTKTAVLEVVSDTEVISLDARKRHPVWAESYAKFDLPHICFTPLWRNGSTHLVLAVPRSTRDGPIGEEEREVFRALAARFRAAALMTQSLRNEAALVLKGAFDAMSIAAILLDGFGQIIAVTDAAEPILRAGALLNVRGGRLLANRNLARDFDAAVSRCVRASVPPASAVTLAASDMGGEVVTIRVAPLPRDRIGIGFDAAAIVVIEQLTAPALAPNIGSMLTPAENQVALALLEGIRPAEIAVRRDVSVETVRRQVKNLFSKVGVSGHVEFISKMRSRGGQ